MKEIVEAALSQTPEIVDQLIVIEKLNCIGWFTFCLVLLVILKFVWNQCKDFDRDYQGVIRVLFSVLGFFILFGLIANPINYLQAIYAPKAIAIKVLLGAVKH